MACLYPRPVLYMPNLLAFNESSFPTKNKKKSNLLDKPMHGYYMDVLGTIVCNSILFFLLFSQNNLKWLKNLEVDSDFYEVGIWDIFVSQPSCQMKNNELIVVPSRQVLNLPFLCKFNRIYKCQPHFKRFFYHRVKLENK